MFKSPCRDNKLDDLKFHELKETLHLNVKLIWAETENLGHYGERGAAGSRWWEQRSIQLSGRLVEQLMENLRFALMDLGGPMEQKYLARNRQWRKWGGGVSFAIEMRCRKMRHHWYFCILTVTLRRFQHFATPGRLTQSHYKYLPSYKRQDSFWAEYMHIPK